MATITRGSSLAADEVLTNTKLHNLVDLATVSSIVRADFATGFKGVTVAASSPSSPVTGELWFSTAPASGQGVLHEYDGNQWRPIAVGFLGAFVSGATIQAGDVVKHFTSASSLSDSRIPVTSTTEDTDYPIGVAVVQMNAGSPLGPIITQGKVYAINKETGAATAIGDGLGPAATDGACKSTTVGSFGVSYGAGAFAVSTEAAASGATTVQGYVTGWNAASWWSLKQTAAAILASDTPGALATFSGSFGTPAFINFSAAPAGTVGRLIQIRVEDVVTAAGTVGVVGIAVRMESSGLAVNVAPTIGGAFHSGAAGNTIARSFKGTMIVPGRPGTNNRAEYYIESNVAASSLRVSVWERGAICGGSVTS